MAKKEGCRDCKRCTELGIKSLAMLPVRATLQIGAYGLINLFQKKCPRCGHKMSDHKLKDDVA